MTDQDALHALFDNIDTAIFDHAPSSPLRPKPVPCTSATRRKRVALSPLDPNSRESQLTPRSDRQHAVDALLAGLDAGDFGDVPSSPPSTSLRCATWRGREPRPANHVPIGRRYLRGTVVNVLEALGTAAPPSSIEVQVQPDDSGPLQCIRLEDDWIQTALSRGDTVHIIDGGQELPRRITRSRGFIIVHPDTLVSATRVADAVRCPRKPVLQEKVRSTSSSTPSLVYGNILHSVLQRCLVADRWDCTFRARAIDDILAKSLEGLWECNLELNVARAELLEHSQAMEPWAARYVQELVTDTAHLLDPRGSGHQPTRSTISKVLDIEEDILSPRFGMKGKVDATVLIRSVHGGAADDGQAEPVVAPFEIKTGRSNTVMEHRAQTALYTLLLSDRYDCEVGTGLLYYTRHPDLIKVDAARNELRGLVMMRNQLASYLRPLWREEAHESLSAAAPAGEVGTHRMLPEAIDDERVCTRCFALDSCALYRRAIEGEDATSMTHLPAGLAATFASKTDHLSRSHNEFFRHWEHLLSLEEEETTRLRTEIWTTSAIERQRRGRCFAAMRIDSCRENAEGYTYRFVRLQSESMPLAGQLATGDAVLVSVTDGAYGVGRGFIGELSSDWVDIQVEHDLTNLASTALGSNPVFRIDKDELIAGLGRIRENLATLFYAQGDERRRRLIVDLEPPRSSQTAIEGPCEVHLKKLNPTQRAAVRAAVCAQDYALILGMPGTGKTSTMVALIRILISQGKSVLLTSYTHSAVDTILAKVADLGDVILRLGNASKVMPELRHLTKASSSAKTIQELDDLFMTPRIVATTALSAVSHPLFLRRRFDVCIVDEASQIMLPVCLGPLRYATSFILVGDHNQLPPLIRSSAARRGGLDVSLFRRLCESHPAAVVSLSEQYRMNDDIMAVANRLVYDGQLRCGDNATATRRLSVPHLHELSTGTCSCPMASCWLIQCALPERCVIFIDTDAATAREERVDRLVHNPLEAEIAAHIAHCLTLGGLAPDAIAIITPYRQQIKTLQQRLSNACDNVEVLTADRSQGRDKECVIVSLVRSNARGEVGELLHDWRRLNVCFTRAKSKLLLIGSRATLEASPVLASFFELCDERGWIMPVPPSLDCLGSL